MQNLLGGDEAMRRSPDPGDHGRRRPAILARPSREATGNFYLDDEVLAEEGITDLSAYGPADSSELQLDIFLDA